MILTALLIHKMNEMHRSRYDGMPNVPYYHPEDLGLQAEDFSFQSGKWRLAGSRYYVKKGSYKALVVFFHGLGAGRDAYLKEIAAFAKQGYLVYAFDNTGCEQSQGPYIYSLSQIVKDQRAFFKWLDEDPEAQGLKRFAVGHSWGGYATIQATRKEYRIEKAVSISGFVSLSTMYALRVNPKMFKIMKPWISFAMWLQFGKDGDPDGVKILKESKCPLLYIQGTKDNMVPIEAGLLDLQKRLAGEHQIKLMSIPNRKHNPYMTLAAENELNRLVAEGITNPKKAPHPEMDLEKTTEQEEHVMKAMFDFLAK